MKNRPNRPSIFLPSKPAESSIMVDNDMTALSFDKLILHLEYNWKEYHYMKIKKTNMNRKIFKSNNWDPP